MGDGSIRSGQSFSYYYFETGSYNIRLTVRDNEGLTDTEVRSVYVWCDAFPYDADNPEKIPSGCLEPL